MNSKLATIYLNTHEKVNEFYEIVQQANDRIYVLIGIKPVNAKETNVYSWLNLLEPITIKILADEHGNTDSIYELIKEFEVE